MLRGVEKKDVLMATLRELDFPDKADLDWFIDNIAGGLVDSIITMIKLPMHQHVKRVRRSCFYLCG